MQYSVVFSNVWELDIKKMAQFPTPLEQSAEPVMFKTSTVHIQTVVLKTENDQCVLWKIE